MSEIVALSEETESLEAPEAEATPSADELATLKKRLAGKDQAYSALKKQFDAIAAEKDGLSKWKAEKEYSDLSEVEKLQRSLADAESRIAAAEQRAERARLASTYPLAVEMFGDDPLPSEERLAALQQRLTPVEATGGEDTDTRVDPNRPRRTVAGAKPVDRQTTDELVSSLRGMANPFYD